MNKLVFVVEDNPADQKFLKVHFEEKLGNYTVRTFAQPDEMLQNLKEKPFAVVLDHFFQETPSKTGLHYLKQLKRSYPSVPVIYYTTLEDEKTRKEVMSIGAEEYIQKNSASLVRLRTALDQLHQKSLKKGFFQKLFGR